MQEIILWAAVGTGFTFLMTTLGSATVFFFRKNISEKLNRIFLGFAAGVMIAALIWSLLIPAIEEAEEYGINGWIPAAGGMIMGIIFIMLLDWVMYRLRFAKNENENLSWHRSVMMMLAVTLHNIPEGMAVGLSCALALQGGAQDMALYTSAMTLALGIGIQNFPEGAAISLPLRQNGISSGKAFLYGCASGIVEPIFGILTVLVAGSIKTIMPWLLSFAAGAMFYVVVEELIPSAHFEKHFNFGTIGVAIGFLVMMILDVALG